MSEHPIIYERVYTVRLNTESLLTVKPEYALARWGLTMGPEVEDGVAHPCETVWARLTLKNQDLDDHGSELFEEPIRAINLIRRQDAHVLSAALDDCDRDEELLRCGFISTSPLETSDRLEVDLFGSHPAEGTRMTVTLRGHVRRPRDVRRTAVKRAAEHVLNAKKIVQLAVSEGALVEDEKFGALLELSNRVLELTLIESARLL